MSAPYAVLVDRSERRPRSDMVAVYGPLEEDEADALARRLREDYDLRASVVRLQPWSDDPARRPFPQ